MNAKTRKQIQREEFEEHFYATWPTSIAKMNMQQLENLRQKCADFNAGYPETCFVLRTWVLTQLACAEDGLNWMASRIMKREVKWGEDWEVEK